MPERLDTTIELPVVPGAQDQAARTISGEPQDHVEEGDIGRDRGGRDDGTGGGRGGGGPGGEPGPLGITAIVRELASRYPLAAKVLAGAAGSYFAWLIAGAILPSGLPVGVVLLGLVLGSLYALTAMGLVLIYRATRIINFAQAEMGGLAAAVAVVMVVGSHLPYFLAVPIGLLVALATGWVVEAAVVRRFFTAPRLILTIATIGVAQILGAGELGLPTLFTHLSPLTTFTTPFTLKFIVGPIVFNGNDVLAMCVVPVVLFGLWWFFGRTDTGIAIRAAADSNERAMLLGIPVRRLSRITWVLAAGLSGLAAILTAPITGPDLGVVVGPVALLVPLAAAVVGRMERLTTTFFAALGISVFEQAVFWSYPQSTTVDVALFALVLGALLFQRRQRRRVDDPGLGGYVALREVRPMPKVLAMLPEVRLTRRAGIAMILALAVLVPAALSGSQVILLTYVAIYGILAVSLVVLAGFAGQVSLGQFAFAGLGAATVGSLLVHLHADLFVALLAAAVVGALAAGLVGIPALKMPGLFLAVTTMAFAVPVSSYFLNSAYFPSFTPAVIPRPTLFGRVDLSSNLAFYELCLAALVVCYLLARNFRRTRAGRVAVAVRDNERGAAAFGVSPRRAKLVAFAFSGALAGVAGGLYGVALRGIGFSGFDPEKSVVVFTMVVVGGLGSLPGALLGALYVEGAQYFLSGAAQLLATGAGLLLLLMVVPGGLGEVAYSIRDRLLSMVAAARSIEVPSLRRSATPSSGSLSEGAVEDLPEGLPEVRAEATPVEEAAPLLRCHGVDAAYGQVRVLFGVDFEVAENEVLALLGTNGAGKSTVLRVISGLMRPQAGNVVFAGRDISAMDPVERVKAGIVTVPGGRGVFPSLSVTENLRLGSWLSRHDQRAVESGRRRVLELFEALTHRLDTQAGSLSGGEQQMLTLAQALLCRPKLLLIDELSLGLAPTVVAELLQVVRQLADEGTTIVVVEQSLNVAATLAPQAVFMERGQVRFRGPTAELAERPDLARAVFLRSTSPSEVATMTAPGPTQEGEETGKRGGSLSVRGVSVSFGGVSALSGVDLDVAPGEVVGIIGANGAGKTTFFDVLSGFLAPDAGRIVMDGVDVTDLGAPARAEMGLGRIFQDARLFPSLTVSEALRVSLDRHLSVREATACIFGVGAALDSEEAAAERVEELIAAMGLEPYRDSFVSELSTGTRRIVELAGALAHDPTVILLDEPSSGIAQRETEALGRLLMDLHARTGATLVIIEHDIPLVSSIAGRLVCFHLGEVIAEGEPKDVLTDPAVVASYLGTDQAAIARSG
jgi:ABC-type branched-subunit amino acid transport system ATPase component/ABC-type branched-subunit amino acid transport system permease subunit